MKFFALFVSVFAALATAQSPNPITSPTGGVIQAGTAVTVTWTPTTSGTITLQLRSGNAGDLGAGTTIACSYLLAIAMVAQRSVTQLISSYSFHS